MLKRWEGGGRASVGGREAALQRPRGVRAAFLDQKQIAMEETLLPRRIHFVAPTLPRNASANSRKQHSQNNSAVAQPQSILPANWLKWMKPMKPGSGFDNMGNTCFLVNYTVHTMYLSATRTLYFNAYVTHHRWHMPLPASAIPKGAGYLDSV